MREVVFGGRHATLSLGWKLSINGGCLHGFIQVWLFVTLWIVACQTPLCMRFSRQEYWSGLPCPPPGDLPNPGIEPRSPTLQANYLSAEPPRKPKNTGLGIRSLLQGIFLTQESNQGLLHCRRIPYQLSYQGSPEIKILYYYMLYRTI